MLSSEPTAILAFRNGSIGNTLAAVPALRALRRRYPQATLSVVVDPVGHDLLERCGWIDNLIVYDKHGRDRSLVAQLRLVNRLRRLRPSHALLFKRFFRNGLLAYLSGAKVRVGFRTAGEAPFLTHTIPYEERVNVVDLDLRLTALLDVPSDDRHLELFLGEEDRRTARKLVDQETYVVAHYGGQTTAPDFVSAGRFELLLRQVAGTEAQAVFIGAGQAESGWARAMAEKMAGATTAVNLPMRVMAALIEGAALFIGFNSGPAHIAAAAGTPEIVFFRPDAHTKSELLKWSPVSDRSRTFVPPASDSENEWARFLEQVARTAREEMRTTPALTAR